LIPEQLSLSPTESAMFPPSLQNNFLLNHGDGHSVHPAHIMHSRGSSSSIRGADSDGLDNAHGNTALHLAAQKGHLQIVRLLLETGVDANALNEDGMSPLHISIVANNVPIAQYLLEHGASSSVTNNTGQNTLHLAVETEDVNMVRMLLEYVTDPDARDGDGKTAFHRAVAKGQEEIVRTMLMKGVNSQAKVGAQTPMTEEMNFDWGTAQTLTS
jgi:ankyrin repeat protein